MADKLDRVMLVVFTYLDQRLTAHASLPPENFLGTPSAGRQAAATNGVGEGCEGEVGRGDADSGGSSSSSSGNGRRRSSVGGSQGMEPVARLLKVHKLVCVYRLVWFVVEPCLRFGS